MPESLRPEYFARLEAYRERLAKHRRNKPPRVKDGKKDGTLEPEGDEVLYLVALSEATGTVDTELGLRFSDQVRSCAPDWFRAKPNHHNVALAMLQGIGPNNELEGMIGVQIVGAHNLAMEFMRRAMLDDQSSEAIDRNVNRATKLLRAFTTQLDALSHLRGKGQQRVTVEHVTVNQGGQAIVGQVTTGGPQVQKS